MFHEVLEDIIPARIADYSSDSSDSDCGEKRPRATFETVEIRERESANSLEDRAPSTPVNSRRKRRREWVWRPLNDDVLAVPHILDEDSGSHKEDGVNFTSADNVRPVELEINLPISSQDAYSISMIEPGYKKNDAMAEGALILQAKVLGTELELPTLNVEAIERWAEAVTTKVS